MFFLTKRFHGGREIRAQDQAAQVLSTTPYVKALVGWATYTEPVTVKTNRLPKLSRITCSSCYLLIAQPLRHLGFGM